MRTLLKALDIVIPLLVLVLYVTDSGPYHLWLILAGYYSVIAAVHITATVYNRFPPRIMYLSDTLRFILSNIVLWVFISKQFYLPASLVFISLLITLYQDQTSPEKHQ